MLAAIAVIGLLCIGASGGSADVPLWAAVATGGAAVPLLEIAVPWQRRADLLKGVLALSNAIAATGLLGQSQAVADVLALAGGALMAFVALHAERMRRDARDHGDLRLDVIAVERRRAARRRGYAAKASRKRAEAANRALG